MDKTIMTVEVVGSNEASAHETIMTVEVVGSNEASAHENN